MKIFKAWIVIGGFLVLIQPALLAAASEGGVSGKMTPVKVSTGNNQNSMDDFLNSGWGYDFKDAQRMMEDMHRFMGNFFQEGLNERGMAFHNTSSVSSGFQETPDAYELNMDLPGVDKNQIDIRVQERTLDILVQSQQQQKNQSHSGWMESSQISTIHQAVRIPSDVQIEKIESHYQNGILTIRLPKEHPEEVQRVGKRISVS